MGRTDLHIHWYPGHIAKAERQLKEKLNLVDVVIEVRDARIPLSSSYANIKKLLGEKPRLLLLNKADLVEKSELKQWVAYLKETTGCPVIVTDAKGAKDLPAVINSAVELSEPKIQALMAKGLLRRAARAMVVGMPNVGKSSVINKLTKSSKTKIGAKAGVTRQQQWVRINPKLELLDTPGIIPTKQDDQMQAAKLAFVSSVSENAYSPEPVAQALLDMLSEGKYTQVVKEHYKVEDLKLETIALSRNWIIRSESPDTERTAKFILKDFREGRLGLFILDELPSEDN
ncbi:MAG: ribosome biogenesis GTPase YlqF [Candidatus Gastranaerophilales bacterium]|nr:ribosome biogenesis GTPase YlqF [Candidatus Gastranaerophilales bacterium]MCM1072796.1 ribosome biogenesis GTPase YlqF [Bacteroides sp.]